MFAAHWKGFEADEAKKRLKLSKGQGVKGPVTLPDLKGDSRDKVAERVGVGGSSIDKAVKIIAEAPDLRRPIRF